MNPLLLQLQYGYPLRAFGLWNMHYCDECQTICSGNTCTECTTGLMIARQKAGQVEQAPYKQSPKTIDTWPDLYGDEVKALYASHL